jgi:hypothetical protein
MTTPARYEMAYKFCLKKTPKWKHYHITGDGNTGGDERMSREFLKQVVELAESDKKIKVEND